MKKIITLLMGVLLYTALNAQCTTTGFDVCISPSPFVTSFTNPVQVAGTGSPLTVGAKYKFNNISPGIDGIISIDKMSNAVMTGAGVASPNIDDDNAMDETGVPGSQASLFAPRIASDIALTCADRTGYVQFTVTFYVHTVGNAMPSSLLLVPLANPNFLHFDMDGHTVGNNGWFREIGYVQRLNTLPLNPLNLASTSTLLGTGNLLTDAQGTWIRTNGAKEERDNLSRCAQVIEKSTYVGVYTSVSFRFGYEYKASSNCNGNGNSEGRPTRQYGSKFGCFAIPVAAALPVSLTDLSVSYNKGTSTVSWKTLQEINIEKYIIERSTDGVNFGEIGSVDSRNSLLVQQYLYADHTIPAGARALYYRIRIIEWNNPLRLSNVVAVKIADASQLNMIIAPNPASSNVQVKFSADKNGIASLKVYDAAGKIVLQQQAEVRTGNNSISLDNVTKLNEGVYVVKLATENETYSSKLIIWK
jgi:hypothetical protein